MCNVDEMIKKDGEQAVFKFILDTAKTSLAEMLDNKDLTTVKFVGTEPSPYDSTMVAEDYYTAPDYANLKVNKLEWEATSVDTAQKLMKQVILPLTEWFIQESLEINRKATYDNKISNINIKTPLLSYTQKVQQVTHSVYLPATAYTGKLAKANLASATAFFA